MTFSTLKQPKQQSVSIKEDKDTKINTLHLKQQQTEPLIKLAARLAKKAAEHLRAGGDASDPIVVKAQTVIDAATKNTSDWVKSPS